MGYVFTNDQKYDAVPAGTYEVEFIGIEEREPFEGPSKFKRAAPDEKRLGWRFRVLSGEYQSKVIEQGTGPTIAGPKSKLAQLLVMMLDRPLRKDERIEADSLLGFRYRLSWTINPTSEQGRCHVSSMERLSRLPPAAPQPVNGPPAQAAAPPPQAPPPSNEAAGGMFWVDLGDGQPPTSLSRASVQALIKERNLDPRVLKVCPFAGKQEWVTAAAHGFAANEIPF
jgi:hypothetical protein